MQSSSQLRIFVGILFGFLSSLSYAERTVVLTTHELSPYGSFAAPELASAIADDQFQGIAVNVVRCAFDKMSEPVTIFVLPWKRAQYLVTNGKADGFFAASQNIKRDQLAIKSAKIADQKWQWFLLKSNDLVPHQDGFRDKTRVSSFVGTSTLDWLVENGYKVIFRPRNIEQLLQGLMDGKVDAVLANNYAMSAVIAKLKLNERIKSYTLKDKPLSVYFSKKFHQRRGDFIKRFNAVVPSCRAQVGELN